jgi:hypothetical protein
LHFGALVKVNRIYHDTQIDFLAHQVGQSEGLDRFKDRVPEKNLAIQACRDDQDASIENVRLGKDVDWSIMSLLVYGLVLSK